MPRRAPKVARFSVSIPEDLLDELDTMVRTRGLPSRSHAVAALARDGLLDYAGQQGNPAVAGTINLVYDHTQRGLQAKLAALQHKYFIMIVTSMHVHLEQNLYLEVLLVQGPAQELQKLTDLLGGCRGVRTSKLTLTATALPPLLK
jgi:CopG family transcriptional regulator, nickel-responsive regulator